MDCNAGAGRETEARSTQVIEVLPDVGIHMLAPVLHDEPGVGKWYDALEPLAFFVEPTQEVMVLPFADAVADFPASGYFSELADALGGKWVDG